MPTALVARALTATVARGFVSSWYKYVVVLAWVRRGVGASTSWCSSSYVYYMEETEVIDLTLEDGWDGSSDLSVESDENERWHNSYWSHA